MPGRQNRMTIPGMALGRTDVADAVATITFNLFGIALLPNHRGW